MPPLTHSAALRGGGRPLAPAAVWWTRRSATALALLVLGCGHQPHLELDRDDAGADAEATDGDGSVLTLLGVPDEPLTSASFPAGGPPPASWSDPPQCPLSTEDEHCAACWTHTDYGADSLDRNDSGDAFGTAFAVADFNGDGYPDVAVGAPDEDYSSTTDAGRVYVYLGSSRGFQPWLVLDDSGGSGPHANARFGANLLAIDLDASDGFTDLVVAYGGALSNTPIFVYEGSASGFGTPTTFTLSALDPDSRTDSDSELGFALVAGDFDDDDDQDLAVGAPNYNVGGTAKAGAVFRLVNSSGTLSANGRLSGATASDRFGHALAAGNVASVGYDYLIVGAPGAGNVTTYDGTTVDATDSTMNSLGSFGRSLLLADLTSDGIPEILVGGLGANFVEIAGTSTKVTAQHMGTATEVRAIASDDLDEDSDDDLVLQLVPASGDPEIHFLDGDGTTAPGTWFIFTSWDNRVTGDAAGSMAHIAELDGDGDLDLLLGAPGPSTGAGDVHVFAPGSTGWSSTMDPVQTVDQETELQSCDECTVYARPDGSLLCGDDTDTEICVFGACVTRGCGDGYRQTGAETGVMWTRESCDDGNNVSGDGCTMTTCLTELVVVSSRDGGDDSPSRLPPAVAEDGNLDLLFVYNRDTGDNRELAARRANYGGALYDEAGMEPRLTLATLPGPGWDAEASVSGLPTGGWVVVWRSPTVDGGGSGIAMRIVETDGTLGPVDVANQTTEGEQVQPRVATLDSGYVVVWTDASGTDGPFGRTLIKARRFDFTGAPIEDEWVVSDPTDTTSQPAVAAIGDLFLVAYSLDPETAFDYADVLGQRFGSGSPDTAPFTISDTDGAEPALAVLDSSTFIAAWTQRDGTDWRGNVQSRTVPTTGDPPTLGTVQTHGATDNPELAPSITALGTSDYLVAYETGGRRRGLDYAHVGGAMLATEISPQLEGLLDEGFQGDVTLLGTWRGVWFAWSDANFDTGTAGALRSFVAFLLPGS